MSKTRWLTEGASRDKGPARWDWTEEKVNNKTAKTKGMTERVVRSINDGQTGAPASCHEQAHSISQTDTHTHTHAHAHTHTLTHTHSHTHNLAHTCTPSPSSLLNFSYTKLHSLPPARAVSLTPSYSITHI